VGAQAVGEIVQTDDAITVEHERPLDDILQLANVSRPGVAAENVKHFGADAANVFAVLGVHVTKDVFDEERNVVFMIAQRRQVNVEDVEAEEKILPQLSAEERDLLRNIDSGATRVLIDFS